MILFIRVVYFLFFFVYSLILKRKCRIYYRTRDRMEKCLRSTASHRVNFYIWVHAYVYVFNLRKLPSVLAYTHCTSGVTRKTKGNCTLIREIMHAMREHVTEPKRICTSGVAPCIIRIHDFVRWLIIHGKGRFQQMCVQAGRGAVLPVCHLSPHCFALDPAGWCRCRR